MGWYLLVLAVVSGIVLAVTYVKINRDRRRIVEEVEQVHRDSINVLQGSVRSHQVQARAIAAQAKGTQSTTHAKITFDEESEPDEEDLKELRKFRRDLKRGRV